MQSQQDAERRRRLLVEALTEVGWTANRLAKEALIAPTTLYNFLRGESNSLSVPILERCAEAMGVPLEQLTGGLQEADAEVVYVRGEVEAGVWREAAEWPRQKWQGFPIPVQDRFKNKVAGLFVKGPSMNRVYPEDTILVCLPIEECPRELKTGDRVVVERVSSDGLYETTVKELEFDSDGHPWLWPRSDHPKYQTPIEIPRTLIEDPHPPIDGEIRVIAVVVGSYRPENF